MSYKPRRIGIISWVVRVMLATAAAISLAGPLRPIAAAPATTDEITAARLGGTRASFAQAFGKPVVENEVNGSIYDVPGFGLVLAQFRHLSKTTFDPGDRAAVVTFRSPRPEELAATTPDGHDWTIDQAFQVVVRFLPTDVALDGPATPEATDPARQGIERSCYSDTLAAIFPREPGKGACQIAFLMPTSVTVSYVTLILGDDNSDPAALASSCADMQSWGQATGARMESALSTLADVAQIDENDPNAVAQLRDLSSRFTELSAAQSAAAIPRAARKANAQLVAAFDGFAGAIGAAATGLEKDDRDALAQAVADLDAARVLFDAATARVLSVLQRCGLTG
jgi:hypothetical protein